MDEIQYRAQTSSTGEISGWRDLVGGEGTWDYRSTASGTRLEFIEIRIKPKFVPGYYQCTSAPEFARFASGEVLRMDSEDDLLRTDCAWIRVNVTPAD
jgi:hypothetical protein